MSILSDKVKTHADNVKNTAEKMKDLAGKAVDDYKRMSTERRIKKLEEQLRQDKEEQEKLTSDRKAIEDERARLVEMSEKELMVEVILAIRGLYHEFAALKDKQTDLTKEITALEEDLSSMQQTLDDGTSDEVPNEIVSEIP